MSVWSWAGRLWRTVRWLRPGQILGRARFRLWHPRPNLRPPPPLRAARGIWTLPPSRPASLLDGETMCFLGETHSLAEVGWDKPEVALLWRYNQHYFDDLNAEGARGRTSWHRSLVQRWIEESPPGKGTGWAPYPTSLRIVNWIKWFAADSACTDAWRQSLAVQARWLARRLEWHLLGNHLFVNAKALVFAGLYFEGPEAARWWQRGWTILLRELPEQILADGAQFERSPMYHALALEDVLDLLNVARWLAPPEQAAHMERELLPRARTMLDWLRHMTHPDGAWARFNDCAEGIAPTLAQLERYAGALGIAGTEAAPSDGITPLQPSGYVHVRRGSAFAIIDAAPIGPNYLPGHAHADTLSFELSVHGRQLVVNRGTSVYGTGARRQVERGTAAHSTLQIGTLDSSEVWAGFRVGRRASPGQLHVDRWEVCSSHDGYAFLPGRPTHRRRWRFDGAGLQVEDSIEPALAPAVARYHLSPGLALRPQGDGLWNVTDDRRTWARVRVSRGQGRAEAWQHAAGFGRLVDAVTLAVELDQGRADVHWSWEP